MSTVKKNRLRPVRTLYKRSPEELVAIKAGLAAPDESLLTDPKAVLQQIGFMADSTRTAASPTGKGSVGLNSTPSKHRMASLRAPPSYVPQQVVRHSPPPQRPSHALATTAPIDYAGDFPGEVSVVAHMHDGGASAPFQQMVLDAHNTFTDHAAAAADAAAAIATAPSFLPTRPLNPGMSPEVALLPSKTAAKSAAVARSRGIVELISATRPKALDTAADHSHRSSARVATPPAVSAVGGGGGADGCAGTMKYWAGGVTVHGTAVDAIARGRATIGESEGLGAAFGSLFTSTPANGGAVSVSDVGVVIPPTRPAPLTSYETAVQGGAAVYGGMSAAAVASAAALQAASGGKGAYSMSTKGSRGPYVHPSSVEAARSMFGKGAADAVDVAAASDACSAYGGVEAIAQKIRRVAFLEKGVTASRGGGLSEESAALLAQFDAPLCAPRSAAGQTTQTRGAAGGGVQLEPATKSRADLRVLKTTAVRGGLSKLEGQMRSLIADTAAEDANNIQKPLVLHASRRRLPLAAARVAAEVESMKEDEAAAAAARTAAAADASATLSGKAPDVTAAEYSECTKLLLSHTADEAARAAASEGVGAGEEAEAGRWRALRSRNSRRAEAAVARQLVATGKGNGTLAITAGGATGGTLEATSGGVEVSKKRALPPPPVESRLIDEALGSVAAAALTQRESGLREYAAHLAACEASDDSEGVRKVLNMLTVLHYEVAGGVLAAASVQKWLSEAIKVPDCEIALEFGVVHGDYGALTPSIAVPEQAAELAATYAAGTYTLPEELQSQTAAARACGPPSALGSSTTAALASTSAGIDAATAPVATRTVLRVPLGIALAVAYARRHYFVAFQYALRQASSPSPADQFYAASNAGLAARALGLAADSVHHHRAAYQLASKAADTRAEIVALSNLATTGAYVGDLRAAQVCLENLTHVATSANLVPVVAAALESFGVLYAESGDLNTAHTLLAKSLSLHTTPLKTGDSPAEAPPAVGGGEREDLLRCLLGVVRGVAEADATIRALARAMGGKSVGQVGAGGATGAVAPKADAAAAGGGEAEAEGEAEGGPGGVGPGSEGVDGLVDEGIGVDHGAPVGEGEGEDGGEVGDEGFAGDAGEEERWAGGEYGGDEGVEGVGGDEGEEEGVVDGDAVGEEEDGGGYGEEGNVGEYEEGGGEVEYEGGGVHEGEGVEGEGDEGEYVDVGVAEGDGDGDGEGGDYYEGEEGAGDDVDGYVGGEEEAGVEME